MRNLAKNQTKIRPKDTSSPTDIGLRIRKIMSEPQSKNIQSSNNQKIKRSPSKIQKSRLILSKDKHHTRSSSTKGTTLQSNNVFYPQILEKIDHRISENPENRSQKNCHRDSKSLQKYMVQPLRVTPIKIEGATKKRKYSHQNQILVCVPYNFDLTGLQDFLSKDQGRFYDKSTIASERSNNSEESDMTIITFRQLKGKGKKQKQMTSFHRKNQFLVCLGIFATLSILLIVQLVN